MMILHLNPSDPIQSILDIYPLDTELHLYLSEGIYHQKLKIKHDIIHIHGSKTGETKISYGDYAYQMHEDGLLYNTFRTSTVMILSKESYLYDLTIENAAGSGFTIGQGIALTLYGLKSKLENCKLLGHQDTLFLGPLPLDLCERYDHFLPLDERVTHPTFSIFNHCHIEGDVDFIFGSGTALFNECIILAKAKGYIAAPSTYESFPYGLIFYHSKIISLTDDSVFLARPWRTHGATLFYECHFEGLFDQARYQDWDKPSFRFKEYPYMPSKFSSSLSEEEIEQLLNLIQASL
jgi:pectinesterase